jgi:hypothetical protein
MLHNKGIFMSQEINLDNIHDPMAHVWAGLAHTWAEQKINMGIKDVSANILSEESSPANAVSKNNLHDPMAHAWAGLTKSWLEQKALMEKEKKAPQPKMTIAYQHEWRQAS